ncbi:MAG: TetR/AcrR family transcriptional regulator [Luminiphilus sp.]|nr:TetR/AcrR family transcriptional regulator [Luminiphilus sp.]
MADTQRQRLEAREEAILVAATAVLGESGVDGARMAEIARRADVAEGTVYLYYKNKHDLLEAVVDRFWRELTLGAIAAISDNTNATEQLRELAHYHLQSLITDFKLVEITSRAGMRHDEPGRQLPQVREYVRVFDAIMQRGINQQEFQANTPIWQMRDVFYGSLEYSARTLVLRAQGLDKSVVENVIGLFNLHRVDADSDKQPPSASIADHDTIIEALARIESKLS